MAVWDEDVDERGWERKYSMRARVRDIPFAAREELYVLLLGMLCGF